MIDTKKKKREERLPDSFRLESSSPGRAISYSRREIFRGCFRQGRKTAKGPKNRIEYRSHHHRLYHHHERKESKKEIILFNGNCCMGAMGVAAPRLQLRKKTCARQFRNETAASIHANTGFKQKTPQDNSISSGRGFGFSVFRFKKPTLTIQQRTP
jgi:hypothetical protein